MWPVTECSEKQTLLKLEEGLRKDVSLVVVLEDGSHLRILTVTAEGVVRIDSMTPSDALRIAAEGFRTCHAPSCRTESRRVEAVVGDERGESRLLAHAEGVGPVDSDIGLLRHQTVEVEPEPSS